MGDTPAALFFARTFRAPIADWLQRLRGAAWATCEMPDQPTSRREWKSQQLLPPTPRADIDTAIWPSEMI
eukprot:3593192-Pyramimonas_sp.AAC.1